MKGLKMYNPYNCKTCGFADPTHTVCQLKRMAITESDFCSKHSPEKYICDNCGNQLEKPLIYVTENESVKYLCPSCFQKFSTCTFCEHAKTCYFEEDNSLPKLIKKTVNMGNGMVAQTQIRNPELIEKTCKQKCDCYQEGEDCMRDYTFCKNHKFSSPF